MLRISPLNGWVDFKTNGYVSSGVEALFLLSFVLRERTLANLGPETESLVHQSETLRILKAEP